MALAPLMSKLLADKGYDGDGLRAEIIEHGATPYSDNEMDYDPVRLGYVSSIARPGSTFTGIFVRQPELAAKRVELAHDTLPHVRRLVLWHLAAFREQVDASANAAQTLGPERHGSPRNACNSSFVICPSAVADTRRLARSISTRIGIPCVLSRFGDTALDQLAH
jgi:hypothetical protein